MVSSREYPFCEICPIVKNQSPDDPLVIHEGKFWRASLRSNNQALVGTCFITLKTHKPDIEALTSEEWEALRVQYNALARAVRGVFAPELFNFSILMNDAFQPNGDPDFVGQPHMHVHIKPRYSADREFSNIVFTDPEFGHYLRKLRKVVPELAVLIAIATEVKRHFIAPASA